MLLSVSDRERIQEAVREAEARTRGEIVCVVAEEASDYSEVPLIWAAAISLAAPTIPLTFMSVVITVRQIFQGWAATEWISAQSLVMGMAMLATMQFGLFVLIALLGLIPEVRRFLTPETFKRGFVRQRAFEQFIGKGLVETKDRAGVMIYVSLHDRCAELIADQGINAKVQPDTWKGIVAKLVREIKAGRPTDGYIAAIRECGDQLARHFPAQQPNPNELADAVTELSQHPRSA